MKNEVSEDKKISMHIYLLPNLLTTGNLFFGFYAIILASNSHFIWAAYAIVAAAVFDMLDGRMARLTRSTSAFGAQYDSLCDLASFCLAPALVTYAWALKPFGRLGWMVCFFFVACGALRLARFNVQSVMVEKIDFQGLPTPMAAGIVASSIIAFNELQIDASKNFLVLFMMLILSLSMVSHFRYRSFKDIEFKRRLPFFYLVIGLSVFALIAYWPEVMLFVLFSSYAVLGLVFGVLKLGRKQASKLVAGEAGETSEAVEDTEEEEL